MLESGALIDGSPGGGRRGRRGSGLSPVIAHGAPMQPTSPQLLRRTCSAITIRWDPNVHEATTIIEWEIEWEQAGRGWCSSNPRSQDYSPAILVMMGRGRTASAVDLQCPCEPLKFRLRGKNRAGWGPWSSSSTAMQTTFSKPGKPAPPKAFMVAEKVMEVVWESPRINGGKPISGFKLYGKRAGGQFKAIYEGEDTTFRIEGGTSFSDDGESWIKPNVKFTFMVMASNELGDSPLSDPVSLMNGRGGSSGPKDGAFTRDRTESAGSAVDVTAAATDGATTGYAASSGAAAAGQQHAYGATEGGGGWDEQQYDPYKQHGQQDAAAYYQEGQEAQAWGQDYNYAATAQDANLQYPGQYADENAVEVAAQQAAAQAQRRASDAGLSAESAAVVAQAASAGTQQPFRIAQLPSGWVECWDPTQERVYYWNPRSNVSQWEKPPEPKRKRRMSVPVHEVDAGFRPSGYTRTVYIFCRAHWFRQD